jgi:hypothetical protein
MPVFSELEILTSPLTIDIIAEDPFDITTSPSTLRYCRVPTLSRLLLVILSPNETLESLAFSSSMPLMVSEGTSRDAAESSPVGLTLNPGLRNPVLDSKGMYVTAITGSPLLIQLQLPQRVTVFSLRVYYGTSGLIV